jgi:hypothetical protein
MKNCDKIRTWVTRSKVVRHKTLNHSGTGALFDSFKNINLEEYTIKYLILWLQKHEFFFRRQERFTCRIDNSNIHYE